MQRKSLFRLGQCQNRLGREMDQQELLNIVEKARQDHGWSLREIGHRAGLSHATYAATHRFGRSVTWDVMVKLLDAVGYKLKVVRK